MKKIFFFLFIFLYSSFVSCAWLYSGNSYNTAQEACQLAATYQGTYANYVYTETFFDNPTTAACYASSNGVGSTRVNTVVFDGNCFSGSPILSNGHYSCSSAASCNSGDLKDYTLTERGVDGVLNLYVGAKPTSFVGGCEYTCSNYSTGDRFVMDDGSEVVQCHGVATGVSSSDINSNITDTTGTSEQTLDSSNALPSPEPGCISGSNGSVLCPKDNTDCMTVNGINLCKTAENPSGCVTVPDVLNNPVELCSGQNKECVVKAGSLMCVVDPNSPLPKDCVKSASSGEIACLTTDGQALKVKTESSTVTNPDGSVTETTTETNNVLCPAVRGRARDISPNPDFWTDGTPVLRDSNGRTLNQYPCDDQKKTVKTTNPDGSVSKTETGNLGKFTDKNGNSGNGNNQNGTDMSGVEGRLDTANSHLDGIEKSLNPDGSSNPQGQIDGLMSSLNSAETSRNGSVSDYFSNLSNPFAGKISPVSIFPNIFPNSVSCGSGYIISDTISVPFTGKSINFNLDPCSKFAPLREILTWLLFVFTVFKVVNIATGQKVGR